MIETRGVDLLEEQEAGPVMGTADLSVQTVQSHPHPLLPLPAMNTYT